MEKRKKKGRKDFTEAGKIYLCEEVAKDIMLITNPSSPLVGLCQEREEQRF